MASNRPKTRAESRIVRGRRPAGRRSQAAARSLHRQPGGPRSPRQAGAAAYQRSAQQQLRRFRKGSLLAVALTALVLLVWGAPVEPLAGAQPPAAPEAAVQDDVVIPDPAQAVGEATGTIRDLAYGFYAYLPRLLLALGILLIAVAVTRVASLLLRRTLGGWERTMAVAALVRLVAFLVAAIAMLSILAGDVRAVVGSVGLLGLAASWALQTPIESFTGWLLNSFRGYYRVGDRVAVGEVFGDVYRIDVLTTTVWEAGGGPGKPVAAAQSTGALITFPNWEVLRSNIVNYSRDFPFVWDEITVGVANESDLGYCSEVLARVARTVLGEQMEDAARRYEQLLRSERLLFDVDEVPYVYLSAADSWTQCTIRYLVPVRTRRKWSSDMLLAVSRELAKPEHRGRILNAYPRTEAVVYGEWPAPRIAPEGGPSRD